MDTGFENPYLEEYKRLYPPEVAELDFWERFAWGVRQFGSPEAFQERFFVPQQELRRRYGWGIPTEEAIKAIAEWGPLVEMGAGTGYWAWLLRQVGADILAYDVFPPDAPESESRTHNPFHGYATAFATVLPGTPELLREHAHRSLLLCWPPKGEMAAEALDNYSGYRVIHVGAPGLTASPRFYTILNAAAVLKRTLELPQWWNDGRDRVEFWERRQ